MIRIVHLYPAEMNIYGDRGNVLALLQRCAWRGIKAAVKNSAVGENLLLRAGDIMFIGGGQDSGQARVAADLTNKSTIIKSAIDAGTPALAICGGYQLFGKYFRDKDGTKLAGIAVFNAHTIAQPERMIGNVVLKSKMFGRLVGFENHSGATWLADSQDELGVVKRGFGNNGQDSGEGAVYKNALGTYLHGSFLPKNPKVADYLIAAALEQVDQTKALKKLDDNLEHKAAGIAAELAQ